MKRTSRLFIRLLFLGVLLSGLYYLVNEKEIPGIYPTFQSPLSENHRIVIFPLLIGIAFPILLVAVVISWIDVIASIAEAAGKGPRVLHTIAHGGFLRWAVFDRAVKLWSRSGLMARLLAGGGLIFIALLCTKCMEVFDDWEAEIPRMMMPSRHTHSDPQTRWMGFYTPDNNIPRYRTYVKRVARDLLGAGARLVIVMSPGSSGTIHEQDAVRDSFWRDPRILSFRMRSPGVIRSFPPPQPTTARSFVVEMTTPARVISFPLPEILRWYPLTCERYYHSHWPSGPFWPNASATWNGFPGQTTVDIALAAAGRTLGHESDTLPHIEGNTVALGGLQIPVTGDGTAYAQVSSLGFPRSPGFTARLNGDSVVYELEREVRAIPVIPAEFVKEVSGKVILLEWWYPDPLGIDASNLQRWLANALLIEAVLNGASVVKIEWAWYFLSLLLIVISCTLMNRPRLGWGVCFTLLMGLGVFAVGAIALRSHHVLLDTCYPLIASILCVLILPLIRLAHEAR